MLSKEEENGRRDEEDIQKYRRGGVGRRREQDSQDIEDKVRQQAGGPIGGEEG